MRSPSLNRKRSIFNRLAVKIIAGISITVLLIQLAFTRLLEDRIYQYELENTIEQQVRFTEANAIYIAEQVSEGSEDNVYLVLSSIVGNPLIVGASLEYADERAPIFVGDDPTPLKYSFEINGFDDNDQLVRVGHLTTYATTAYIDGSRSTRIAGILGLILLVFLVVLIVSALAVQIFVGIPLKRITNAIESQKRIPTMKWTSKDEMGTVVDRLNYLHKKLNEQVSGLEKELSASERREAQRISNLANASLEGILIFNDENIIDVNIPMTKLCANEREKLLNTPISGLFDDSVIEFLKQPVVLDIRPIMNTTLAGEDGRVTPVELYLSRFGDGSEGNKVVVVRDISERIASEEAMWKMAHYDSLTGLPNRRYFTMILSKAIVQARNNKKSLSVAYLDLDNFKLINDSRGHSVGDQLLCAVGESLREALAGSENCARLGGDEFVVLLDADNLKNSLPEVLERILATIVDGPHCRNWKSLFGVSIGVATMHGDEIDKDELLMRADLALYKAKDSSHAKICYYSDVLDARLKRERTIVEKLIDAIDQNKLEIYYQPQVVSTARELVGFEALLRWNDPVMGQVPLNEIIEIAEREGLVSRLGRWVINTAVREALTWPEHIRLAVNLSPIELVDETLPEFIKNCLDTTGFLPTRFEIEITETALISDSEKAVGLLSELKELGIKIALDDFGTGYSSLRMLQMYPIDRIKIDRSFVQNLCENTDELLIVTTIIELAGRLNLEVIAEGIESEIALAILVDLGCQEVQGFLFSKPIPKTQIAGLIDHYENFNTKVGLSKEIKSLKYG